MIKKLNLETAFLILGDYEIYNHSLDCINYNGLIIEKIKLKVIKTAYYENKRASTNIARHIHLCQVDKLKIYIFIGSINENLFSKTTTWVEGAYYSDSLPDAIQLLSRITKQHAMKEK